MVFLRSSRKPLPKYTEYLYFAVPILASAIHTIPQYAWAIRHDECHPLNPIMPGTKKYLIYIIFVTLLVPTIFVLYNVLTSIRVILTLYFKQRKVSRALNSASFETNRLLKDALDKPTSISKTGSSRGTSLSAEDTRQLQAVRRVYRACIRIAMYPLTPILWWIFNATFYGVQYHITMTYQSDVYTMTVLMYINWVAFPSIVILNFLVFLTDPGVLNVVSEVRKLVRHRFGRAEAVSGFTSASQQTTPRASMIKKNGIIITERAESNTSHSDAFSLSSNEGDTPQYSPGRVLEENGSFTTAIASLGDDNVMRSVRNDSSAQGFYGAI
ncbi:hypothetical protein LPJ66_008429 [Kickxella alabastrina]|uniref:Uncharacterized protein n=1 Tax=Kickxella alabastrina TaxID=61397 RepID=A0ACC1IEC6_9FUNG|nr:hypothetical protein LPJ66_008429 [Kickxella alabastrina]